MPVGRSGLEDLKLEEPHSDERGPSMESQDNGRPSSRQNAREATTTAHWKRMLMKENRSGLWNELCRACHCLSFVMH